MSGRANPPEYHAWSDPNIVTIHDVGDADGINFLVMELVAGRPLGETR